MPTRYHGTPKEVRALNAYIPLLRAADSVAAHSSARLGAWGLTLGQFGVLEALLHLGPLCQRELSQKLLRTGGNITLLVDNLERGGLVRRERGKQDRRYVTVRLTGKGEHLIRKVFPGHVAAIVEVMETLSATEQETLRRFCRKLGRAVAQKSSKGGEQ